MPLEVLPLLPGLDRGKKSQKAISKLLWAERERAWSLFQRSAFRWAAERQPAVNLRYLWERHLVLTINMKSCNVAMMTLLFQLSIARRKMDLNCVTWERKKEFEKSTEGNTNLHPFQINNSIFVKSVQLKMFKDYSFRDIETSSGLQFWAFQLWPLMDKSVPDAAIHYCTWRINKNSWTPFGEWITCARLFSAVADCVLIFTTAWTRGNDLRLITVL